VNSTRPSSLSPEDAEKIIREMARRGASIQMTDARFTALQTWLLGAIGVAIIGSAAWLIQSVNELNITMTRVVTQNEARDAESVRMRQHIEALDKRIIALELLLSQPVGQRRR
jgi:hypothetical protein